MFHVLQSLETLAQIQAGGSAADPVRGPGCPGACPEAGAGAARPNRPEDRGNPSDRASWHFSACSFSQHTVVRFFDGIGLAASRYVDKVVPIPVAKQVQVPMVNTASGTAEELSAGSTGKSSKKAVSLSRL